MNQPLSDSITAEWKSPGEQSKSETTTSDSTVSTAGESPNGMYSVDCLSPEVLKDLGNQEFKNGQYENAVNYYTQAISRCEVLRNACIAEGTTDTEQLNKSCGNMAIYLCNRAFAHTKLENFGSSIIDATEALRLSGNRLSKAFYRRGVAHLSLANYKQATQDFRSVCRLLPKDADAERRFKEAQKLLKAQQFSAAIQHERGPSASETISLAEIEVPSDYAGPVLDENTKLDLEYFKTFTSYIKTPEKVVHKKFALQIGLNVLRSLKDTPNVVSIDVDDPNTYVTVCGDVHGQYYDLLNIFEKNGYPSPTNKYLFNGDFVDRGSFSVEVILTLYLAKLTWPDSVFLARGNHESRRMTHLYGFEGEMRHKYSEVVYEVYCETFESLPLAHIINGKVFVVHGGLSTQHGDIKIKDIQELDRRCEPEDGLMSDLLWADPQNEEGSAPSKRGVSTTFGPDWTQKFLESNNLSFLIRSHEMKNLGYEWHHNKKALTVFSAPNYCDQMQNLGAYIRLKGGNLPAIVETFAAVDHPPIKSMNYASHLLMG